MSINIQGTKKRAFSTLDGDENGTYKEQDNKIEQCKKVHLFHKASLLESTFFPTLSGGLLYSLIPFLNNHNKNCLLKTCQNIQRFHSLFPHDSYILYVTHKKTNIHLRMSNLCLWGQKTIFFRLNDIITQHPHIHHLTLSDMLKYRNITRKNFLKLMESNQTVTSLRLNYRIDSAEIAAIVNNNSYLKKFQISDNVIVRPRCDGFSKIFTAFAHNRAITELDLFTVKLSYGDVCTLSDSLSRNNVLKHLNMSGCLYDMSNWYKNKSLCILFEKLKNNTSLHTLKISNNHARMGPDGDCFKILSDLLKYENTAIQYLDISSLHLTDKDLGFLSEGLTENKTVTTLHLDYNDYFFLEDGYDYDSNLYTPDGQSKFAHMLLSNKTLTLLSLCQASLLSPNILAAIKASKYIKLFDATGCVFDYTNRYMLPSNIYNDYNNHSSLVSLHLNYNSPFFTYFSAVTLLQHSPSLKNLEILRAIDSRDDEKVVGLTAFILAIGKNTTLSKLNFFCPTKWTHTDGEKVTSFDQHFTALLTNNRSLQEIQVDYNWKTPELIRVLEFLVKPSVTVIKSIGLFKFVVNPHDHGILSSECALVIFNLLIQVLTNNPHIDFGDFCYLEYSYTWSKEERKAIERINKIMKHNAALIM